MDMILNMTQYRKVYYILRTAVALCFIGHGSFGIITKSIWCNYFAVLGIGHNTAYQSMPVVGLVDILLGVLTLAYPVKAIPAWLVIWGIFTALLRPLSGEPFAEFIDRSGNFGAPLAMLILCGSSKNISGWFIHMNPITHPDEKIYSRLVLSLKTIVFLVLLGHGWLNLIEKKSLLQQYAALGFPDPVQVAHAVGIAEIVFAFTVLIRPMRPLLFAIFIWKAGTELFYPHYALLEWIERAGSYGSILALWVITEKKIPGYTFRWPFIVRSFKIYNNQTR